MSNMKRIRFGVLRFRYDCKAFGYGTPQRRIHPFRAALLTHTPRQYQACSSHGPSRGAHPATDGTASNSDPKGDDHLGEDIQGLSGRRYMIERILQDKHMPLGRVCLARSFLPTYIVKKAC